MRITVVGAGISGLASAYVLIKANHQVKIIAKDFTILQPGKGVSMGFFGWALLLVCSAGLILLGWKILRLDVDNRKHRDNVRAMQAVHRHKKGSSGPDAAKPEEPQKVQEKT